MIDDEEGDADGDDDIDGEEEEVNDFLILSPWAVREVSSDVQEEIEQETTTVIIDEREQDYCRRDRSKFFNTGKLRDDKNVPP